MRRRSTRGRRAQDATRRNAVLATVAATTIVLAGCQVPARLGVKTTVVALSGTCDHSAVVVVGASLPLSGPLSALGRAERTGLELGVEHVNDRGGVEAAHRCIELMYKDDRSDPGVDKQAILDLVNQEHASMVVGPFLALDETVDGAHLGALGDTATSFSPVDETYEPRGYPYTFPVASSIKSETQALAAFVGREGWDRVTVLSSRSVVSDEAVAAFNGAKIKIEGSLALFRPFSRIDSRSSASSLLSAARGLGSQGVVVFGDTSTLTDVLEARRALDSSLPVVAATEGELPTLPSADLVDTDVVIPAAVEVGGSVPQALASLRSKVLAASHTTTLTGAITPYAQAYDSIELFAGAVTGVNAYDPNSLRTYLENSNFQGLLGSYGYSSGAHQGISASEDAVVPLDSLSDGLFVK